MCIDVYFNKVNDSNYTLYLENLDMTFLRKNFIYTLKYGMEFGFIKITIYNIIRYLW